MIKMIFFILQWDVYANVVNKETPADRRNDQQAEPQTAAGPQRKEVNRMEILLIVLYLIIREMRQ